MYIPAFLTVLNNNAAYGRAQQGAKTGGIFLFHFRPQNGGRFPLWQVKLGCFRDGKAARP